ncbi:GDP-L-fucose synthetase [Prochlorococcus marinus str. MIT 9302]|uniref:GDP-L-fucose synthase n=1 Tax=Prochlorococcus marinus str. MIT 9302 TaxID=74545 RepID=A0A0A2A5L2_PROMR|nr:GDP-L-fucose synthase [Prochlorococcus marinus]KGF96895.1 GDP-L-fucose synthetase [Prochlorococcus marinus str. MIT 9302]
MQLINKKDTIFVAGHTGMVGKALVKELLKKGYNKLYLPTRKELNLLNHESVKEWFNKKKPKVVILAAAKVGGIEANYKYPADFILQNLKIQTNVIENSWENNVKRFLFFGSSCIYPKLSPQPIKEEYLLSGALEETNEPYAIAKIAGLKLCSALTRQHNFNAISLMPTNLYGPGDNYNLSTSHVLPAFINRFHNAKIRGEKKVKCWGSGNPQREFLHVDDLANASIFILENYSLNKNASPKNDMPELLNIGTGKDIKIKDLAYLIAKKIDYKGEIIWDSTRPDGTPRKLLDVSRLKNLGWESSISLEQGIDHTIKTFVNDFKMGKIRN